MERLALTMGRLAVTSAALLAIGFSGCGGDDGQESQTRDAAPRTSGGAQTVEVSEAEFKLSPSDPKVDTGVVDFKVTNDGKVTHSLEIEGPGGEVALERALQPGQSGKLEVNLSKAGSYEWYCPIDGHKDSGMQGEIVVAGDRSSGGAGAPKSGNQSGGGSSY
jgi:uncharacterized cupredoxin-like copper-binding protein